MTRLKKCLILLACLLFGVISPKILFAQNSLSTQDLSTINVDDLSDDQIRQLVQQAQNAGLTQSQMEQQALQRGMPPDQIQKLEDRINKLSTSSGNVNIGGTKGQGAVNTNRSISGTQSDSSLANKNSTQPNFDLVFDKIRIKVFGEELFNNPSLKFEPNLRLATPPNYVLGADDELSIDIYGYSEVSYKVPVSPEGNIQIPNVGPVSVGGLTIEQARIRIKNSLEKIYTGMKGAHPKTFVNINLGNIKSIKVNLVGEIKLPGTYTLPSLATVFNALYSSGGPNKDGSFRRIELIRNNKVIKKIDVYKFLMNGVQEENIGLMDQDVIKVSPYVSRIEFKGEVKRPGIYEIIEGETLENLLNYAGGFTDKAYTHRIKVIQNDTREKTVYDVSDDQFSSFKVHRGDLFQVEPIINRFANRVQIMGAVFRPGIYALENGLTLSQLIKKADGLKEDAFVQRATIFRLNEQLIPELLHFDASRILNGRDSDIHLRREDSVVIASRTDIQEKYTVSIGGEVIKPDTVPWAIHMHIQDLILQAGGLTDAASFKRIEITRRTKDSDPLSKDPIISKVFRFDISPDLQSDPQLEAFELQPFDDIAVRALPGYTVQEYATIEGEVLYNGRYGLKSKNQKISDLIKEAGGLTSVAFPEGATLLRQNNRSKIEKDRRRQLQLRLKSNSSDSLVAARQLTEMDSIAQKQAVPVGINLEKILQNPGSKYDLVLNDGDTIKIPQRLETVKVSGDVLFPVRVRFDKHSSLKDYVNSAGGFSANAARKRTYVVYANGAVKATRKFLFFNSYPSLLPGSEVVVPDKGPIIRTSLTEVVGIATSITTLAVLIFTVFRK